MMIMNMNYAPQTQITHIWKKKRECSTSECGSKQRQLPDFLRTFNKCNYMAGKATRIDLKAILFLCKREGRGSLMDIMQDDTFQNLFN